MEALNLSHCASVCNSCIGILGGLINLRRLNLDGILWIGDGGLTTLADSEFVRSGKLNAIWLDGFEMTNDGLLGFFKRIIDTQQNVLYFNNSSHLDLYKFSFSLSNSNNIKGIQLLWISFCDHIEDNAIVFIAKLSNLIALTLRKAHKVSSRALSFLFTYSNDSLLQLNAESSSLPLNLNSSLNQPSLKWLEHLDLSEVSSVTDSVIGDICNCCGSRLRSLLLNWCWELTDKSVEQIVNICHSLRQLSLVGNSLIKCHDLVRVPLNQPSLILLNLTQCSRVSDDVLEQLSIRMPLLYVFDFFGERVGSRDFNDICHFDLSRIMARVPICFH